MPHFLLSMGGLKLIFGQEQQFYLFSKIKNEKNLYLGLNPGPPHPSIVQLLPKLSQL